MKKHIAVSALLLATLVLGGCRFGKKDAVPESPADAVLKQYSYDGVPTGLAAQHRIEALSVHRVAGEDRFRVVNEYATFAVEAIQKKELFVWILPPQNDTRIVAYAQRKEDGSCVGFTAHYALSQNSGSNSITGVDSSELCSEQADSEREANEKLELQRANELQERE